MIVDRQRAEGWGKSIVDRLSVDLHKNFPGIEGFSSRNIWRMRAFYVAWACGESGSIVAKREIVRDPYNFDFLNAAQPGGRAGSGAWSSGSHAQMQAAPHRG
jgi:hypothetical protein